MFEDIIDEVAKAHGSLDHAIEFHCKKYKPGEYSDILRQLKRSRRELENIINLCDFHSQANGK